jgi:DUF438 domain-containing protein
MSELLTRHEERVKVMKEILRTLHEGGSVEEAKAKFRTLVQHADPREIAAAEQQLLAEGLPVADLCRMCDLHSHAVFEVLPHQPPRLPAGHPAQTFHRENEAILALVAEIESLLRTWQEQEPSAPTKDLCLEILERFHRLMDVDKHYKRKEYLLFPFLERHGITGPSQVMWAKDDEVRVKLNLVSEEIQKACPHLDIRQRDRLVALAKDALAAVTEMVRKEERILLPMALNTLGEEEWAEIWRETPQFGWCLVPPEGDLVPPTTQKEDASFLGKDGQVIQLPTGRLTVQQLLGILRALPIDITFVDHEDRVAYFSDGPERIFDRNVAVLGRKVQNCHPPKSVDVVDRILNDFRSGRQNVAEFWINFRGKFVHIRYFAVRDESGRYLGTLEVTQDVTKIRQLEGERRLLQYDAE